MARTKKTNIEKLKELNEIIADAKIKLKKIQAKWKLDVGELACKNKLDEFDLADLDLGFKNLYEKLSAEKQK